jgi:hypothetical protein
LQVFIGLTTDLTDLTDEKGEWVGEMLALEYLKKQEIAADY